MKSEIKLRLYETNGDYSETSDCLSFYLNKEYYTAYNSMGGEFVYNSNTENFVEVELLVDGNVVHSGLIDTLKTRKLFDKNVISVASMGKTAMLLQNKFNEGIYSSPSLNKIFTDFNEIQGVTHENNSTNTNYIYIAPKASLWETITNVCLKIYNTYPYINGANEICYTKSSPRLLMPAENEIISIGKGENYKEIVSDIYMKDLSDKYNYHYHSAEADSMGIIRKRYIPLDKQWLQDSNQGLLFKQYYTMRGMMYNYFTLRGYSKIELKDIISISGSEKEINRIYVRGNSKGIQTTIYCYYDKYCNV